MYMYSKSKLVVEVMVALLFYSTSLLTTNLTMYYFPKGSRFVYKSCSCIDLNIVKNNYWKTKIMG